MELMKYVDTMEESPLSRNISHSAVYKGPGSWVSVAERGPPTATMETPASLRKRPSSSPLTAEAHWPTASVGSISPPQVLRSASPRVSRWTPTPLRLFGLMTIYVDTVEPRSKTPNSRHPRYNGQFWNPDCSSIHFNTLATLNSGHYTTRLWRTGQFLRLHLYTNNTQRPRFSGHPSIFSARLSPIACGIKTWH